MDGLELADWPRGEIVCLVDLLAISSTDRVAERDLLHWDTYDENAMPIDQRHFGNFGPRRYAWYLRNVRIFPDLHAGKTVRGHQRLWHLPANLIP